MRRGSSFQEKLDEAIAKSFKLLKPYYTSNYQIRQNLHRLSNDFNNHEKKSRNFNYTKEEYEVEKNKIIKGLLEILDEIELNNRNLGNIKYNVAIAELGKAVVQILSITKGTDFQNQALMISSRYFRLEKQFEQNIERRLELEKLKEDIGLIYSKFT